MSVTRLVPIALCAATLTLAETAGAVTLTFDSGTYAVVGTGHSYTEAGFTFTTPQGNHFDSNTFPGNTIVPGVPYLVFHEAASNAVNNVITLTMGGGVFDLLSFELVDEDPIKAFNPVINPPMTVVGSGGQSIVTPLGAAPGFAGVVTANFLGVTSVTFDINLNSTVAGNVLLDNVVVQQTGVVPLPASLWLMLAGIGGLGLAARGRA